MNKRLLAIAGLSSILFLGACGNKANTNTTNTGTAPATASPTPTPVPKTNESAATDPNLKPKIEAALKAKGLNEVTVDIGADGKVVLRGSVAKGKMTEANATAMEANGGKPVTNQITEK